MWWPFNKRVVPEEKDEDLDERLWVEEEEIAIMEEEEEDF